MYSPPPTATGRLNANLLSLFILFLTASSRDIIDVNPRPSVVLLPSSLVGRDAAAPELV